ncbi:hypothetical protein ACQ7HM_01435 [Williamsia sp. MIQD14]|uniref:hypothetical protein n=1 Tax=Williamsia sp. MIQD14 TaxID=3425703 RepID=UPI003D9FE4AA
MGFDDICGIDVGPHDANMALSPALACGMPEQFDMVAVIEEGRPVQDRGADSADCGVGSRSQPGGTNRFDRIERKRGVGIDPSVHASEIARDVAGRHRRGKSAVG